jgi:uncharacterized protein
MKLNRRSFMRYGAIGLGAVAGAQVPGWASENKPDSAEKEEAKASTTEYRTLGKTGMKVTAVSVGAMLTRESAVLRAAFDKGVNYVDTARAYGGGRNESVVGEAIKGRRDKIFVATKTALHSKSVMTQNLETSLELLGTDYVDVLQLHGLSSRDRVLDPVGLEFLAEAKKQGKVRFTGVTSHSNEVEVIDAAIESKFFDVVLIAYNFKSSDALKAAMGRAAKAGLGVVAMKTQAGGYETDELGPISPHQAALKWVLQDKNIHTAIPSMVNMAQVEEDTEVMHMKLSRVDRQILDRYGRAIETAYCHRCGECEGTCPKGVDIPTVNRCMMYAEGYREMGLARETYAAIPFASSLAACSDCPECTAFCRQGLHLTERLGLARRRLV